jgi:hypothetical protein
MKGFTMSKGYECTVKGNYTVLYSDSTDFRTFPACRLLPGNTAMCLLSDNWSVILNCLNNICWNDLNNYCIQNDGLYFYQTETDDYSEGLLSLPACALPTPHVSVDFCSSDSQDPSSSCLHFTAEECPGYLYNDNQSCLLIGDWTVVTNVDDPSDCIGGTVYQSNCVLNGTWTLVTSDHAEEMSIGCSLNYGVGYDNGKGCALEGEWSMAYCHHTSPCDLSDTVCVKRGGFGVEEGCVLPGRWSILDECTPDGKCDVECDWPQCKTVDGFYFLFSSYYYSF